ncbi:MAG: hypothetical protein OXJ55_08410 [Caldilineaceae bacterium]|nr:hypothetical protein [Caldilineaceae bacterium]
MIAIIEEFGQPVTGLGLASDGWEDQPLAACLGVCLLQHSRRRFAQGDAMWSVCFGPTRWNTSGLSVGVDLPPHSIPHLTGAGCCENEEPQRSSGGPIPTGGLDRFGSVPDL